MNDDIKIELIQAQLQKQTASLTITNHLTQIDKKGLQFLFYAEYDIIYQTFDMKHAAYLQKKIAHRSKWQQSEQIQRKFEVLSDKNHQKIGRPDNMVDRLLNRLQFQWNQRNIPYFHRYYFQKYIDNDLKHYMQSLQKIIWNEQKLIKSGIHIIYSLDRAVQARQVCLIQFKRFLNSLKETDIQDYLYTCTERLYFLRSKKQKLQYQIQGYKINKITDKKVSKTIFQPTKFQLFSQLYHHFIKLTLHAIQLISKWKDYIYSLTSNHLKKKQQIDYYFQDENYLLRIINDNSFVSKSFLANYFKFSPKNDPFLLMPLINLQKDEKVIVQKSIQKQSGIQQSTELKCLKKILTPKSQIQILQILSKTRLLVKQYQINIKGRKVFDLNLIKKINNLDYQNSLKNLSKSLIKLPSNNNNNNFLQNSDISFKNSANFKLSKISSSNSMKNLRLMGKFSQKQRDTFQQKKSFLRLSDSGGQTFLSKGIKPNNVFNPQKKQAENFPYISRKLGLKLMNSKQLQLIKHEIKQKIKSQLKLDDDRTSNKIFKKPQLADYIESQVKKVFLQTQFQQKIYNNKLNDKQIIFRNTGIRDKYLSKIFVQTYSIEQSQLPSHLNQLYQNQTLLQFQFMQSTKQQLLHGKDQHADKHDYLENLPNLYFINIKQKDSNKIYVFPPKTISKQKQNIVSSLLFTIKYLQKETLASKKHNKVQRIIQILYMTIKSKKIFDMERVILKVVQFLFKYETANAIVFSFYYENQIKQQKQKIDQLKKVLQVNNCIIAEKYFYKIKTKSKRNVYKKQTIQERRKITQVKFHFNRKDDSKVLPNINNIDSRQISHSSPLSLQIGLYGLFSSQKLRIVNNLTQKQSNKYLTQINYDYLMTEIIKNHINSDYLLKIKNKNLWNNRLKVVIQNILSIKQKQSNQQTFPFIQIQTFNNISELNKTRNLQQKYIWTGIDDLTKSNIIKMLSIQLKITLPYICKAFINSKGIPYFRFDIKDQIQVLNLEYCSSLINKNIKNQQIFKLKIFLFSSLQKKNIQIGLFDATHLSAFINKQNVKLAQIDQKYIPLTISDLLNRICFANNQNTNKSMKLVSKQSQYIRYMFVPMFKLSSANNSSQQDECKGNTINPIKCKDFESLSKSQSNQLILGDNLLWKYNVHLQNGIRYHSQTNKSDIIFQTKNKYQNQNQKKTGLIILLIPENIVIYSRIF